MVTGKILSKAIWKALRVDDWNVEVEKKNLQSVENINLLLNYDCAVG